MLERDGKKSPKYEKLRAEAAAKREASKGKAVERVYETLRNILPEAEKRGLKLGIENRQALEEIPLEGDFEFFFREFDSPNVVYWHDIGHAQIKENLGLPATTPSISNRWPAGWPDFTFTTWFFPRATMPRPAPARSISPRSSRS